MCLKKTEGNDIVCKHFTDKIPEIRLPKMLVPAHQHHVRVKQRIKPVTLHNDNSSPVFADPPKLRKTPAMQLSSLFFFIHMVQHVVNHASYHRGQVTTLLRQIGAAPASSLDLIAFYRERA